MLPDAVNAAWRTGQVWMFSGCFDSEGDAGPGKECSTGIAATDGFWHQYRAIKPRVLEAAWFTRDAKSLLAWLLSTKSSELSKGGGFLGSGGVWEKEKGALGTRECGVHSVLLVVICQASIIFSMNLV